MRRVVTFTTLAIAAAVVSMATPAYAGEITGSYKPGETLGEPERGKVWVPKGASECSYSGLNDGYLDPRLAHGAADAATRTQNYGGFLKLGIPDLPPGLPGYACNPVGARR